MKKWYALSLLLCIVLFGSVFGFHLFKQKKIAEFMANRPIPELPVEVTTLSPTDWTPTIESIGFIEPFQGVTVTTQVSGLVDKIHFSSGDEVQAGQLLVELESSVENANLDAAKGRLPAVKNALSRTNRLYKQGSVSKGALDDAQANYNALKGEIASLEATIARKKIRAPFDGVIGIRQINLGEYLQPGHDIARLENLSRMRMRFIVPQKELSNLKLGTQIEISTDAYPERHFNGEISAIEPSVDFETGVIQLQAEIPNADRLLRSGMYAELSIKLPELKNQIVVPSLAVAFSLYGENVYVLEEKTGDNGEKFNAVFKRGIKVEERRGDQVLVASGLEAGQTIVTAGHVRLQNGARVQIVEDDFIDHQAEFSRD